MYLHLELQLVLNYLINLIKNQVILFVYLPKGSFNGSLSSFKAHELGTFVLQRILDETNKTIPDEVIIGQALTASQGQNPARQTALKSDLPNSITATVSF